MFTALRRPRSTPAFSFRAHNDVDAFTTNETIYVRTDGVGQAGDTRNWDPQTLDARSRKKLCPVVIDESLVDVDSLLLARRIGWTGAVVKSPKGLTNMILIACVAGRQRDISRRRRHELPGRRPHTNGKPASPVCQASHQLRRTPRQFLPAANQTWEARFPGIFRVTDGLPPHRRAEQTRPQRMIS